MRELNYKTELIIMRSFESKEADRIYSAFSKERGKLRFIGIGARKLKAKLASGLEPITRAEVFLVNGRLLDRARGVIIFNQFQAIKANLEKAIVVKRVLQLLDKMSPEAEASNEVYEALVDWLFKVEKENLNDNEERLFLFRLLWRIIIWNGIQPDLFNCIYCQNKIDPQVKYQLALTRGIICVNCLQAGKNQQASVLIDQNVLKMLRIIPVCSKKNLEKIIVKKENLAVVSVVIKQILSFSLGEKVNF